MYLKIDVIVHPFIMHRQPDVWDNPDEYRPERFTKENRIRREGYFDYVPFSAGPRKYVFIWSSLSLSLSLSPAP